MLMIGCNNSEYIHREIVNTSTCITKNFRIDTQKACGDSCAKCPYSSYNEYDSSGYRIIQVYHKELIIDNCTCNTQVYLIQKQL
jgi:predicted nucleic-acid-binding Zn-ribbon protein